MTTALAPDDLRALKTRVHQQLAARPDVADLVARPVPLRRELRELVGDVAPLLSPVAAASVVEELCDEVAGLGPLEPLLADASITEIMLNGADRAYVERDGVLEPVDIALDNAAIMRIVEKVVAPLGLRVDRSCPLVDARLPDGSRLHAVIPPLAIDGPCVTIRRFGARVLSLVDFAVPEPASAFLAWAVAAGWNILVCGGTGSGKTTLLNTLSAEISPSDRIVTIEETAELRLRQPHVVRLEARPPNAEGAGCVTVRDLVRTALRMRPDRLVVGEVRGSETVDMLAALNTGHDGSLSTVHANSASDALLRLETLAMLSGAGVALDAVRTQLGACIDLIVAVGRGREGHRSVQSISEVVAEPRPRVRPLFTGVGLAVVGVPQRAARRFDAPPARAEWFGC